MKNVIKGLGLLALLVVIVLTFSGCSLPENKPTVQETEQKTVEENQQSLLTRVPAPKLETSLERENIKKRLELFNQQSKISYIYFLSYGRIVAYHVVEGKISSGNKRMTTNQKLENGDGTQGNMDFVVESPSLDGTYGHSGDYIFFWTTEGIYIQWNGEYMLSDEPLILTVDPLLVREIK